MSVARLLLLLALCLLIRPGGVMQIIPYYQMQKYDDEITKLYDSTPATTDPDITKRVIVDSGFFLGAPYHIGALGEGEMATFDQSPLYRTDVFDCQTFVSTVLALAESKNIIEFRRNIVRIRYKDGETSYFSRNHFTSVDWNKNNKLNGYLKDITRKIRGKRGHSIALTAIAEIDKPNWYKVATVARIKRFSRLPPVTEKVLLYQLHTLANEVKAQESRIAYLPLDKLFDKNDKPNLYLFNQIPSGAIIEIVRPNWDLTQTIGTHLNVSHLGFAIRTKEGLMFREASSTKEHGYKVIDYPLIKYLKECLQSPTIRGINVQQVISTSQ